MLRELERSTIKFLRKKKKTFNQIAQEVGCTRKTVAKVLKEPTDKVYARDNRVSQAEQYRSSIEEWLKQDIKVTRMLDIVRYEVENRYAGSKSAFYDYVARVRCEMEIKENEVMIRKIPPCMIPITIPEQHPHYPEQPGKALSPFRRRIGIAWGKVCGQI